MEIARCLVSNPEIILLDEPFTEIDPVTIIGIQKIITGLRDSGISILITDHRELETLAITDRSYIIRGGKVLCHGTADEVLNHPLARKYYFGETAALDAHLEQPVGGRRPVMPRFALVPIWRLFWRYGNQCYCSRAGIAGGGLMNCLENCDRRMENHWPKFTLPASIGARRGDRSAGYAVVGRFAILARRIVRGFHAGFARIGDTQMD